VVVRDDVASAALFAFVAVIFPAGTETLVTVEAGGGYWYGGCGLDAGGSSFFLNVVVVVVVVVAVGFVGGRADLLGSTVDLVVAVDAPAAGGGWFGIGGGP